MKVPTGIRFASSVHAADVIDVVVRADQEIDLLQPRLGDRRHDPVGIAPARIAAVDEQRLAASATRTAPPCRLPCRRRRCREASQLGACAATSVAARANASSSAAASRFMNSSGSVPSGVRYLICEKSAGSTNTDSAFSTILPSFSDSALALTHSGIGAGTRPSSSSRLRGSGARARRSACSRESGASCGIPVADARHAVLVEDA